MALIELAQLSGNWKQLQKNLKAAENKTTDSQSASTTLKRKRASKQDEVKRRDLVNGKKKYQKTEFDGEISKMEEPALFGASKKRYHATSLTSSHSMPSIRQFSMPEPTTKTSEALSILTASADFPDIENEGVAALALPAKYIALDCEMVGTGPEPNKDSALARVSVVNYHGHQVYDSYVQVKVPVTDYRSQYSGIEPKHLRKDYARPFKLVRNEIEILLQGRVLVGHGLENDLAALILKHDKRYIRDTSKYSNFRQLASIPGRAPALKTLAEKLLGIDIQRGAHSSVEDARATMALFRLEKEGFDKEVMMKYGNIKSYASANRVGHAGVGIAEKKSQVGRKKKKRSKRA